MPEVPRFEETGFDPGVLQDLERGVIPKGWEDATRKGPRLYFAFQATNRCCRDWMLHGWPNDGDGRPRGLRDGNRWLTLTCQKCGDALHFDLGGVGISGWFEDHQPPVVVAGRIRGG